MSVEGRYLGRGQVGLGAKLHVADCEEWDDYLEDSA